MTAHVGRVARNTLANTVQFGVSFAIQLVLIPLIIGAVGQAEYGLWALAFSVLGFLTLLDFGLAPGVVKSVAEATASGDHERRNRMLSTIAFVYLGLALLAALVVGGLSLGYGPMLDVPVDARGRAVTIFLILGARTWLIVLPFGLFRGVLFGAQRVVLISAVQIASSLGLAIGTWLVLRQGHGLVAVALVNLALLAVEHLAYVVTAYRVVPHLRLSPRLFDRALLREASEFGAFQLIVSLSALVLLRTDNILVQIFLSLSAVALYSVPLKVAEYAVLLLKPLVNNLTPVAAQMGATGDADGVRALVVNGARVALLPAALLAGGAWAFGREALVLWVGPDFAPAGPVLVVLLTAIALSMPQIVVSGVFTMTGRHRFTAAAAVAGVTVNLVASVVLVHPLGLVGVALGTLASAVLVDTVGVLLAASRLVGVSYPALLRRIYWPALVAALVQVAVSLGLKSLWPPATLLELVLEAVPGGVAALAVFGGVFLEPAERAFLARRRASRPHGDGTGHPDAQLTLPPKGQE
jgi:O-antigen/teichoic acid export membrane protein